MKRNCCRFNRNWLIHFPWFGIPMKHECKIVGRISANATGHREEMRLVIIRANADKYRECRCHKHRPLGHQHLWQ